LESYAWTVADTVAIVVAVAGRVSGISRSVERIGPVGLGNWIVLLEWTAAEVVGHESFAGTWAGLLLVGVVVDPVVHAAVIIVARVLVVALLVLIWDWDTGILVGVATAMS